MNRRGFLGALLAAAAAPAIVRADALMRIRPVDEMIFIRPSSNALDLTYREEVRAALAKWWAEEIDCAFARSALFDALARGPDSPTIILPDRPRIILPEEEPWITKSTLARPPST